MRLSCFVLFVIALVSPLCNGDDQVYIGSVGGGGPFNATFPVYHDANGNPHTDYKISYVEVAGASGYWMGQMSRLQTCYKKVLPNGAYDSNFAEVCQTFGVPGFAYGIQSLALPANEFIISVDGTYASTGPRCVNFRTSQGRVASVAYCSSGASFAVTINRPGLVFSGFTGRSGEIIDAIAFNWIGSRTPPSICGDGILTPNEECDQGLNNGIGCCTSNCTFEAATKVCRVATLPCDVSEYCSGSSAECPLDQVKANGVACGSLFGACDVSISKSCDGVSPQCNAPPASPLLGDMTTQWTDFTVTSFGNFSVNGGDVEGRLAVRRNAALDAFTAGLQLRYATDGWKPYTVLVGGDANWSSGELHPNRNDDPAIVGQPAFIFTGGNFGGAAASYLATQHVSNLTNVDASFASAQAYYIAVQESMRTIPINAQAGLIYGDGLSIHCNNKADRLYHVSIDATTLSQVNWYSTVNCSLAGNWIIDVSGSNDVIIKGGSFPGIVERVVYNILGAGRIITSENGIAGHIFAPQNIFNQPAGVTYGIVVAGDVIVAKQNNKPNCKNFRDVTISTRLVKAMESGSKIIYIVDFPDFAVGDLICINSDCRKITQGFTYEGSGAVEVDTAFATAANAGSAVSSIITASSIDDRQDLSWSVDSTVSQESSASSVQVMLVLSALALMMM